MTSLLGRLLRLFPESVPLGDLFTETIARLFETRPRLCLSWLREANLIATAPAVGEDQEYVRIASQRTFASLEHHETDSRPDLVIEVYLPMGEATEDGGLAGVVMIESKIGSGEGPEQLKRYAEHLVRMTGFGSKTLLYITRSFDPKQSDEILTGLDNGVHFKQPRWHDFYRFLQTVEKDTLVEEAMAFWKNRIW